MSKLLVLSTLLLAVGVAIHFQFNQSSEWKVDLNKYKQDEWFGVNKPKVGIPKDRTEIRPFKVNVSNSDLQDLKNRLTNARFVDHIEDTQFTYGFNSQYLKQVVEYWRTKYDWSKEEAKLNAYPQFHTQIEGLDIHFVRVNPSKSAKTVLPLLVIHGWPGSVLEYYKSFPLLTEPDQNGLAFEVIAVSIPGYGYSEAPHQKGFNVGSAARIFVKLMKRLGHDKFVVHGGDWGHIIARFMGTIYAENLIGTHILGNWDAMGMTDSVGQATKTFLAAYFPSFFFGGDNYMSEHSKLFPLWDRVSFMLAESGYYHLQATKPDTIGAALVDSPVGLAAYILEKFSTWTNPSYREREDGGLTEKFTLDELLTNVMIYWTSGNIAASQRFYKENVIKMDDFTGSKVIAPAGSIDSPHEMVRTPRALMEHNFENLIQYTELPRSGHFTAFEEPQLVCKDIRQFVTKVLEQQQKLKAQEQEAKKKRI